MRSGNFTPTHEHEGRSLRFVNHSLSHFEHAIFEDRFGNRFLLSSSEVTPVEGDEVD